MKYIQIRPFYIKQSINLIIVAFFFRCRNKANCRLSIDHLKHTIWWTDFQWFCIYIHVCRLFSCRFVGLYWNATKLVCVILSAFFLCWTTAIEKLGQFVFNLISAKSCRLKFVTRKWLHLSPKTYAPKMGEFMLHFFFIVILFMIEQLGRYSKHIRC